jgi:hypothetical protein
MRDRTGRHWDPDSPHVTSGVDDNSCWLPYHCSCREPISLPAWALLAVGWISASQSHRFNSTPYQGYKHHINIIVHSFSTPNTKCWRRTTAAYSRQATPQVTVHP